MADKLIERIYATALEQPDAPAVSGFLPRLKTVSYRELFARAALLATRLSSNYSGVDFAFVVAARTPDLVIAVLAGLMARLPVAIVDHRLGPLRIGNLLNQACSVVGMVDGLGAKTMEAVFAGNEMRVSVQLEELKDDEQLSETLSFADFQSHGVKKIDGAAIVLFTSGSTGAPKGVCISREDLDNRLAAEQEWFGLLNSDRILGVLPLGFDVGLTQLLGTLWSGGHHILSNSWLPVDVVNKLEQFNVCGLAMSPMVWKSLIGAADKLNLWERLNNLRYVTLSGGTLATNHLQEISSRLRDGALIKTYGQTEMFRIASLKVSDAEKNRLGSVGKPYIGVRLRIVDEEGAECAPYKEGEIMASGMGTMLGYFPVNPTDDKEASAGAPESTWIRTGDYGYLDDAGYLFVRGRRDEMIKILDQRIFPSDVANMIAEVLGASHIEVIPIEKEPMELAAFYLDAETNVSHAEVLPLLRKQLASHLVPRHVVGLTAFPSTSSGKVDKLALREMIAK